LVWVIEMALFFSPLRLVFISPPFVPVIPFPLRFPPMQGHLATLQNNLTKTNPEPPSPLQSCAWGESESSSSYPVCASISFLHCSFSPSSCDSFFLSQESCSADDVMGGKLFHFCFSAYTRRTAFFSLPPSPPPSMSLSSLIFPFFSKDA